MWLELPWKTFSKDTYRLQKRIYKASRTNDLAKTLKLQKLLLHSYGARMIGIRKVTQLNEGNETESMEKHRLQTPNVLSWKRGYIKRLNDGNIKTYEKYLFQKRMEK